MSLLWKLDDIKNKRDELGIPTRAIILTKEQHYLLMREINEIFEQLSEGDKEYSYFFIDDIKWKNIPLIVENEMIDLRKDEK